MTTTKHNYTQAQAARQALDRSAYTLSARLGGDSRRPSARADRPQAIKRAMRYMQ